MGYLYISGCILFTIYGQIMLKWRMNMQEGLPEPFLEKTIFLFKLFLDPWILSAFFAAFIASLFWMAAMSKLDLSFAYPFMSLSFIFVLISSTFILGETVTPGNIIGLILIIAGLIISVKF